MLGWGFAWRSGIKAMNFLSSRWPGRIWRALQLIAGVYVAYVVGQAAAADYANWSPLVWFVAGAMAVRSYYWMKECPKMTAEAKRREWLTILGAWCGMAFILGCESGLAINQ